MQVEVIGYAQIKLRPDVSFFLGWSCFWGGGGIISAFTCDKSALVGLVIKATTAARPVKSDKKHHHSIPADTGTPWLNT